MHLDVVDVMIDTRYVLEFEDLFQKVLIFASNYRLLMLWEKGGV